jgi:RNA polymerase sigma factor (sigma-70 family)
MLDAWRRRRLAERAREGDAEAFAALLRPELQRLHQAAYYLARDADEAADLAQEACVRAYQAFDRFEPGAPLGPWIHRILRNVFLDRRKSAAVRRELRSEEPEADEAAAEPRDEPRGPLEQLLVAERQAELAEHIRCLPEAFREVLVLCDIQGHSYAEVGASTGVPEGTVKSRLSRARLMLRRILLEGREPSAGQARMKGGGVS